MAAVQPCLSGAISKTINMPNEATLEDVKIAYMASWKLGLKANAIYRDGCKMSQPLASKSDTKKSEKKEEIILEEIEKIVEVMVENKVVEKPSEKTVKTFALSNQEKTVVNQLVGEDKAQMTYAHDGSTQGTKIYIHGEQRRMPYKRSGLTIKAKVAGQKIFLRTGEYPDGRLGEVFIDMYREGAAFRSMLNLFAISISTGLQYGIPLEEYVDKFTFTRFEPAGMTDHPNVRSCTSIVDFVFRVLGMEYLGRTDFVQVKPTGIQKNRVQQLEKLLAEARGQKTMSFDEVADEVEKEKLILKEDDVEEEENNLNTLTKLEKKAEVVSATGADQMLAGMMGDAPPCPTCGHITIRSGSCYKCLNCGSTTGCS
jgi:ribonucleoside-diphosphate reductase alpha chain